MTNDLREDEGAGATDWIVNHRCQAAVWIRGRYTGVLIQVCEDSKDRGFHVLSWAQPTREKLWAMQIF